MLYSIPKLQHLSERVWVNPSAVAGVKAIFGDTVQLVDIVLDPSFAPKGVAFTSLADGEFVKVSTLAAVVWDEGFETGARVSFVVPGTSEVKDVHLEREKVNEIVEAYTNEILQAVALGDDDEYDEDFDLLGAEDDDEDEDDDPLDGDYDDPFDTEDAEDDPEHPFDET